VIIVPVSAATGWNIVHRAIVPPGSIFQLARRSGLPFFADYCVCGVCGRACAVVRVRWRRGGEAGGHQADVSGSDPVGGHRPAGGQDAQEGSQEALPHERR
jgi:hypothetical protein